LGKRREKGEEHRHDRKKREGNTPSLSFVAKKKGELHHERKGRKG